MPRTGLIGPSYTSLSPLADCERLGNMYLEKIESEGGKSSFALYQSPGLSRFATLTDTPIRGMIYHNATGRAFVISGSTLFEVFSDGTKQSRGNVANDGLPASMAQSNIQIMIASAQIGYCFTLATNTLSANPANLTAPLQVQYDDGFFVAITANSNKFQYSNALDGLTWNALNVAALSVMPDNINGIIFDHRELIIFGQNRSVAYYDSGNTFTFDVIPGGYIDDGLGASFARVRADNTSFYLSTDERGGIQFKRLNGYTPVRVSTHAVEQVWRGYTKISDANAFAFGFNGHIFIQLNFPSANSNRGASWRYDVATGTWSEVFFLNNGQEYMHKAGYHMYAFNKHLVGDPNSGNIYEMNDTFYTDDGNPIERLRVGPHIFSENERIKHNSYEIFHEMGLATITNQDGTTRAPQAMLKWSDDGGKVFGNEHWRSVGQLGQYKNRTIWRQLGQSRDRVYRWSATDAVAWRLIDDSLDASNWGRKPTQRLQQKLLQQA